MNYGELRKKILDSISIVLVDELQHLKKLEEKGEISLEQYEDASLERKFEYQEWKDDLLLVEDLKLSEHFKYILERAEKITTPPINCLA
jgi:hypothetical protein